TNAVAQAALTVAQAALRSSKGDGTAFGTAATAAIGQITAAAKPLASYQNAASEDGATLVLEALGLQKGSDGSWSMTSAAIARLQPLAATETTYSSKIDVNVLAAVQAQFVKVSGSGGACATAANGLATDASKAASALQTCVGALSDKFSGPAQSTEAATGTSASDKAALEGFLTKIGTAKTAAGKPEVSSDLAAVTAVKNALDFGTLPAPLANVDNSAEYLGAQLAAASLVATIDAQQLAKEGVKTDLTARTETLERDEIGSALVLEGGTQGRLYDVSTGVVYLPNIQEWVMPILIAVCPFGGGCLRSNESIFSGVPLYRSFSLDFGVRAQTLGRTDPRDQTNPAFLLGLSLNPVAFVRVSAGGYFFQNSQTGNKNSVPYVGVTLNVLEAASVLPVLGLGPPSAPKVVSSSEASP
ncbi:MAG TPA: hypothetical protein VK762_36820, partial [Polyangiaceae bacterium]|nr:hypothetical protein [Polyangiaceae bacterium]